MSKTKHPAHAVLLTETEHTLFTYLPTTKTKEHLRERSRHFCV